MLPVSFFTVSRVVEQGQCISENNTKQTAVRAHQPLDRSILRRASIPPRSGRLPSARYVIRVMGRTISLAGNPSANPRSIGPSSHISLPTGSINPAMSDSRLTPPIFILARSHIIRPAGAATAAERPRTNKVRSKSERTMTFPI